MDLTQYDQNDVQDGATSFTTAHAAGFMVIASVVALWALRRGFRGVSVGGAGVHV